MPLSEEEAELTHSVLFSTPRRDQVRARRGIPSTRAEERIGDWRWLELYGQGWKIGGRSFSCLRPPVCGTWVQQF